MAKKSSTTTQASVNVQAVDTNTIDVNLSGQVSVHDGGDNDMTFPTEAPATETPTEKPATEAPVTKSHGADDHETKSDKPAFDAEGTVSYLLKKACGVRYDLDKMVADCNGDADELRRAYNKVSWHLGRIRSCGDSTHTVHTGRYTADGKDESGLLKSIKTLFSQE